MRFRNKTKTKYAVLHTGNKKCKMSSSQRSRTPSRRPARTGTHDSNQSGSIVASTSPAPTPAVPIGFARILQPDQVNADPATIPLATPLTVTNGQVIQTNRQTNRQCPQILSNGCRPYKNPTFCRSARLPKTPQITNYGFLDF